MDQIKHGILIFLRLDTHHLEMIIINLILFLRDHAIACLLHHHQLNPHLMIVVHHNGLETIIVTMRTTMRNAAGMVETVAETMSTPNFALHVNVWIQMEETMILLLLHHHPQEMILLLLHPHHLPHLHLHLQEIVVCITF